MFDGEVRVRPSGCSRDDMMESSYFSGRWTKNPCARVITESVQSNDKIGNVTFESICGALA